VLIEFLSLVLFDNPLNSVLSVCRKGCYMYIVFGVRYLLYSPCCVSVAVFRDDGLKIQSKMQ
jgi:hypothetical protein